MPNDDKTHIEPGRDLDIQQRVEAEEALAETLYGYAGRWVAVENHVVIADSNDLKDLVGQLNGQRATAEVFRVEDAAACP